MVKLEAPNIRTSDNLICTVVRSPSVDRVSSILKLYQAALECISGKIVILHLPNIASTIRTEVRREECTIQKKRSRTRFHKVHKTELCKDYPKTRSIAPEVEEIRTNQNLNVLEDEIPDIPNPRS